MKGTYCLVIDLQDGATIRIGALGAHKFPAGVYVYVGSAQSGIEQRVSRHVRKTKKKRWHIDYLLERGAVLSIIAMPSRIKKTECAVAKALLASDGAEEAVRGFGSSDCDCPTHLIRFDCGDPEWVSESVAKTVAMLSCVYPSIAGSERE